jgi:iron complex outermembrane recepter protein
MRKLQMWCTASAFALAAAAGMPTVASAQIAVEPTTDPVALSDEADEGSQIIVTAQRRQERQVDVPITVTTLGTEQLETANVQELSDITKITPALRFDESGSFSQPSIRGIGTAVTTSGGGANVGIYIDGFYSPNPLAADAQLMNVQSVQVLKGPQGTLFGRNTTGGAILIQTLEPSEETGGQFKASYGRFNEVRAQGYATHGLAPGLAVDIEGLYRRGDGFQTNIIDGNEDVGRFESWSVRTGLRMDFSDAVSLLLRYQHGDVDDPTSLLTNTYVDPIIGAGAPTQTPANRFTTERNLVALDAPVFFRSISNAVQATLKVDLGFADLTSYTQYRGEDVDASLNLDATALGGAPNFATFPFNPNFQLGLPVENDTWSQELLLSSKPGSRLQYTAGLFYFSNRDTYFTFVDNFGTARDLFAPTRSGGSSTTTKSYAAFIDATYEITPQLFLTLGGRYAHDTVSNAYYNLGPSQVPVAAISSDRFIPRVVARYKPSDQSSVYASFTRGYKAPVIDVGGTCQNPVNIPTPNNPTGAGFTCNNVLPETIDAYEVGFKYDDRRLAFEASAYYYDYKNLQVSLFLAGRANIINAASSEIYGAEASLRYELFDGFELNAGGSYTHARYKDFPIAPVYERCTFANAAALLCLPGTLGVNLTPLSDVTMQRTPEFTGNIGARYKTLLGGGEFQISGNLYYTSEFFFGPSGIQFPQEGYEVVSARAQWTDPSDTFTLAVYGDNLTNSRFLTQVQYNTFGLGAVHNKPVTYGVEVGFKF